MRKEGAGQDNQRTFVKLIRKTTRLKEILRWIRRAPLYQHAQWRTAFIAAPLGELIKFHS
ncbi:hypothetical protein DFAR_2000003 [Desulfarculales bacterium]